MNQQKKLKGTQRNGKNTKHKPQESQSDDSDEYSQSEESDEGTSLDESDGEEEQSSEWSVEDEEEGQSSEGSEEDEEEEQSSERSVEDEEQSSEGSEEDEEEGQSSERSVEDEEQSSEGSEEDEEEGQSSEGSDRAGYEYTTDEEDNDPSGEQDSESDEEDKEGSESSEESSRQPEQQGPKEQRSKQNPKESRRKKDLGNQTQLHKRERKKSQGKTPSPAKPAEKLGTNQDISRQKGTPPQSTRPAKKPSTSGTATKIRDTRGEKGKTKQVGKPKQERITKRPKSGEHKKAESPRINGKRASDREERNPNTSTEMENRDRMSRKYPKTSRKGDFDSSSEEDFRKKRPTDSRDLRTFSKDDYDYDDHDYSIPSKPDVRKEERRSKNREGRHYGNDEGSRKQVIREINAEERREPRPINRKDRDYDKVYGIGREHVRKRNAEERREPRPLDREYRNYDKAHRIRSEQDTRKGNAEGRRKLMPIHRDQSKRDFRMNTAKFRQDYKPADPMVNLRKNWTEARVMRLSNASQVCRDRKADTCKELHAYDLVEILAQKEDLNCNILQVIREKNVGPEDVQRVLNNNADIFQIKSDRFCLNPKLKLCTGHLGSKGCKNRRDCIDMHICQNYLKGICRDKSCNLGHDLTTGHNSKVLQQFYLDRIEVHNLLRVLSKNIPKITSNSHKGSADQGIRDSSPDQKPLETSESDVTPPSGDDDESDADCLSGGRVERKKRSPNEKKTHIQSVWSSDSDGDVGIPEICYDSVEGICTRLDIDCERLHSFQHFYWQISRDKSKWFNLHPQLVFCLEKSYCDVSKDGVTLPKLKETDLQSGHTGAVKILSRDEWTSDFQSMTLVNSSHKACAHLRRLCSQKTASTSVKANTFRWYYRDDDQKWVPYDNSEVKGQHITNISEDIEKHYLVKSRTRFTITTNKFNYILDFQKMSQLNVTTNTSREIRRRPLEHLQDIPDRSFLPEDWIDMQPKERMRLVDLDPHSKEYGNVVTLLKDDTYKAKVQKIQRNQNPYLWKAFQIKKEEMIFQYGDEASVKMTDLFHGTKPDIVEAICKENFDFRLHGASTGHIWGKGSYFGNDITYCYRYCTPDSTGLRYLFVAKVLVGAIVLGEKDLRRPPLNTATGALFDTTVDNETHPTIFVKYDKQEYYPYYVITMA